jgi:hypothetical protein
MKGKAQVCWSTEILGHMHFFLHALLDRFFQGEMIDDEGVALAPLLISSFETHALLPASFLSSVVYNLLCTGSSSRYIP